MSKEKAIDRVYDKIAIIRHFKGKPEHQETAWNQAQGYVQALMEMDVISADEYLTLNTKMDNVFFGIEY